MFQRLDTNQKPSSRPAVPGWIEPSYRQTQAAAVLGCAKSFQAAYGRPAWGSTRASVRPGPRFDHAIELYEDGDWNDAFAAAVALADVGHTAAAYLALLMLRYGAPLYGITLQAEPRRIAKWAQLVLRAKAGERREVNPATPLHGGVERRSMTALA